MHKTHRRWLLAILYLLPLPGYTQAPVIQAVVPSNTTIPRYDKLELSVQMTAAFVNPYDYDDIVVQCEFTAPSGKKDVVDGFYMEDFVAGGNGFAAPNGNSGFRVRYAPTETGGYTYRVKVTSLLGNSTSGVQTFQCVASAAPGFIRKNTTNYLAFDNGSQYIPIGENMGWQNNSVINNYTTWLTKLAANGGNFIRVWMSSWAFALEWKNGTNGYQGLKKYKQSSAWYLDWLLDYCNDRNMYVMLTLNNHGQVSTSVNPEWSNNPYNAANGGPATNTWDFFTNSTARLLHKNRLRYIVARYGYSRHIQSWELFNELHWTNNFETHKASLTQWDDEMASYIKSLDVNKHLVSTSYGGTEVSTGSWALPSIDFTQTHFYINSPAIETILSAGNQQFLHHYQKPTLNGEFGLGPAGNVLSANDPNGVHLHNAIWASMFSGGFGTAMSWWWDDYVEPNNLYHHFKPLSLVVNDIRFKDDNYIPANATATGSGSSDVTVTPGGDWGKSAEGNFTIDAAGNINPAPTHMSRFIYGSTYNTANRNPPVFAVSYPSAGQFKVTVAGVSNFSPKVSVYVDGQLVLNENAVAGTTYIVNIAAGQHTIKVDNLGVDWLEASAFVFTGLGSPLSVYALKSADNRLAAGYVLNKSYNWQYLKNNGAPPAVTGGQVTLPGMANGNYAVLLYSTSTGQILQTINTTVSNGILGFSLPPVAWDVAFRAINQSVLPVKLKAFKGERAGAYNRLTIDIAAATNIAAIELQRGNKVHQLLPFKNLDKGWPSLVGKHIFTDSFPLRGDNFYRLRIADRDGSVQFSNLVLLTNQAGALTAAPNPFNNRLTVHTLPGIHVLQLFDATGRMVIKKQPAAQGGNTMLSTDRLAPGSYRLVGYYRDGSPAYALQLVK